MRRSASLCILSDPDSYDGNIVSLVFIFLLTPSVKFFVKNVTLLRHGIFVDLQQQLTESLPAIAPVTAASELIGKPV